MLVSMQMMEETVKTINTPLKCITWQLETMRKQRRCIPESKLLTTPAERFTTNNGLSTTLLECEIYNNHNGLQLNHKEINLSCH